MEVARLSVKSAHSLAPPTRTAARSTQASSARPAAMPRPSASPDRPPAVAARWHRARTTPALVGLLLAAASPRRARLLSPSLPCAASPATSATSVWTSPGSGTGRAIGDADEVTDLAGCDVEGQVRHLAVEAGTVDVSWAVELEKHSLGDLTIRVSIARRIGPRSHGSRWRWTDQRRERAGRQRTRPDGGTPRAPRTHRERSGDVAPPDADFDHAGEIRRKRARGRAAIRD